MAADKNQQLHNMRGENEQLKQQLQFTANMVKELEAAVISGSSDAGAGSGGGHLSSVPDVEEIQRQRDHAMEDFRGVETSFADLHRRYEKLRLQVEEQKQSEVDYDQRHKLDVDKLRKAEDRLKKLKEDAEQKLDAANSEIERLKTLRETDTIGLRAQLKRAEVQMESFERAIEQKNKEIVELTNICDELIAKTAK